ncbi:rhodanese-like domain-containing protein [Agriterribacter sp.]|uniref:rhodanese-like domain-containing protein n=1 Tax=Agriterribacter sp. TaxID=2821509 RepID=UPI002C8591A6|nr:rhodanese-like domain-containing protein [Agriterribacter sp.]HRP56930.1 rhodanese-like domain-containing protein [Agriterribacter sp.]
MSEMLYSPGRAFTVRQLKEFLDHNEKAIIVDTRKVSAFTEGFIPGSVFIGRDGNFIEWAVNLLPTDKTIVLIASTGKEEECLALLVNAGFRNVAGFLDGGFEAWKEAGGAVDMIIDVDAGELAMDLPFDENLIVVDVRRPVEYAEGHVKDALNLPLIDMKDPGNIAQLNERDNLYLHCARGYRSVIAASLLKLQGYNNLRNITGGWESIKHTRGITVVKDPGALN